MTDGAVGGHWARPPCAPWRTRITTLLTLFNLRRRGRSARTWAESLDGRLWAHLRRRLIVVTKLASGKADASDAATAEGSESIRDPGGIRCEEVALPIRASLSHPTFLGS
jgi:hypothetical protein